MFAIFLFIQFFQFAYHYSAINEMQAYIVSNLKVMNSHQVSNSDYVKLFLNADQPKTIYFLVIYLTFKSFLVALSNSQSNALK